MSKRRCKNQFYVLYQTSKSNISEHIKHIYEEGELLETATVRNFRTVQKEGNREVSREIPHYNLDMIISLGYRVKSAIATQFRIWATEHLNEYIRKGFTMDDERLKELGGATTVLKQSFFHTTHNPRPRKFFKNANAL